MESAREGMEGEQLESYGTPSRCHEDIYKAYKLLITNVAGDLHADDVSTIIFVEDLPQDRTWKPLQVLHFLEKRGRFSCYDIEPLETLLKESNRCDLVNKYVTEYKRQYSTAAVQANLQFKRNASAPPHQTPLTKPKRRSLPAGVRDTAPTHPPATFDSVPEEATEIQAELQLQTGALSLSNTVLATPQRSTSRAWKLKPSDFQGPSQEPPNHDPEKIFAVFNPHSMEENLTQHSLMPTHTPTALCSVREASLTSFLAGIMSDEEAQTIVDQALKTGSIEQRNTLAVVVGIAGSGKTSLISRLFREKPPNRYTSTGVAEQSLRGLMQHIANRKSWERLSLEEIFKIFASFIKGGLPEADIASLAKNFTEREEPEPTQDPSEKELSPPQRSTPEPEPSGTPSSPSPSQKSYASETMISLVQTVQGSKKAVLIELLHMIDTGGQPEFMEIMPSLIHNSNLTLLVLNLDQSLDEEVQFVFSENGTLFKKPLPFIRTNRQVIHQLACTLQAKRPADKGSQHSKVSAIGTHRDCVEKNGKFHETLEAMNEEVKSLFIDELMNEVVPVNLKKPDDKDEKVLEELRQHISNADIGVKAKIPFSFIMFEHEAIKYAEQKKDRKVMILSFEECMQVGARVKMSREVVKAALIFFHRHNIFLYFQHILPNVVFLAPQVPLDFVNAIVTLSYKVRSVPIFILAPKYNRFCREGIITEEMLCDKNLQLSDHFIPDIYEPQDAINLFLHIYAIAPLSKEPLAKDQPPHTSSSMPGQKSLEEREYLMMILLEDKPKENVQEHLPSPSKVAPLVIHFSSGCVPNGCFGNTISCLISTYNWEVCRTKKVPKCLAHNIVTLSDPKLPVTITIVNYTQHLEIHVDTYNVEKEDLGDFCSCIRKTIFEAIMEKVFKLMRFEEVVVKPAFLCPCDCDPSHVAEICSDSYIVCKNSYIVCSKTAHRSQGRLQDQHLFWFQDQVQNLEQKPIMLSEAYESLVGISHKWQDVGLQLKLEEGILKAIESDHPKNSRDCLREMLSKWLKVDPRPTWHTLCAALHSETVGEEKLAGSLGAKYVKCKHSLMLTHPPTALCSVGEGERLPRTSTPAAPLPPPFSQQLPHSRQLVHPTPYDSRAPSHSVTHSSSLSGSVHEMSGQSSLGQEASSSQELFTSQVPHMGASNAVYNGLNATGVHSSSQPLLNPCHIVEPSQPGHTFHQPTTLLHPQVFISLPSTSNKKMPSAVETSLAATASNIQPPHAPRELTAQRSSQAATSPGIQRPNALTLSNCSARSTQPPAHESIGEHKPSAAVSLCHLFGKKKGTVEHLVNRKKLYSIICEHKDREYMRLKNRIILDAGCKANPELGLKIYPCGLEDDRGKYATLETDIYIKQKCPRLILESCVVRLVIRVIDCKTGQNLNGDRVLTAEYPLRGRSFRIYQAIDHHSIMQSTSLMFKVRAAAVLIFPPAPQAEEYELVQSPEEEFLEIMWKGGERSP